MIWIHLKFINILPKGIAVNIETSLNCSNQFIYDIINKVYILIIDIKSMNQRIYNKTRRK